MKQIFDPKLQDEIPGWVVMHISEVSAWMKSRGHEKWSIGGVGPIDQWIEDGGEPICKHGPECHNPLNT